MPEPDVRTLGWRAGGGPGWPAGWVLMVALVLALGCGLAVVSAGPGSGAAAMTMTAATSAEPADDVPMLCDGTCAMGSEQACTATAGVVGTSVLGLLVAARPGTYLGLDALSSREGRARAGEAPLRTWVRLRPGDLGVNRV